jgi:hypothetical protein
MFAHQSRLGRMEIASIQLVVTILMVALDIGLETLDRAPM